MATAEYAVGVIGAATIAGVLFSLGAGDHSLFAQWIASLMDRIFDMVYGLNHVWQYIG